MKNLKLGLIVSFVLFLCFNVSGQELQTQDFFVHPPKIDIYKYHYSQALIAKLIKNGDIDPDDVYFEFNDSYESLKRHATNAPCISDACKGLSVDERISLYAYTFQYFGLINSVLRGNYGSDKVALEPLLQGLSQALNKIDIFQGPVFRGIRSAKNLDMYQIGTTVTESSYTSSTLDKDSEFTKLPVLMRINSKKGRLLNELSAHPEESEVLFDRNTKFFVTGRTAIKKQLIIDLEEIN